MHVEEEDENYVMFSKLLAEAYAEGRVNGKYHCRVCGMRYKNSAESTTCCPRITISQRRPRQTRQPTHKLPRFLPMRWKRWRGAR